MSYEHSTKVFSQHFQKRYRNYFENEVRVLVRAKIGGKIMVRSTVRVRVASEKQTTGAE